MKKVLCIIAVLALTLTLGTTAVLADAAIVGELKGAHVANGTSTWDGGVVMVAEGDSLLLNDSGDAYGFVFENLEPGVYKIAYCMDIETFTSGKQMRISPKVNGEGQSEHRCWVDFPVDEVVLGLDDVGADSESGKVMLVAIINVPEGFSSINVGAWQDAGAYQGKLDKVILATADYSFDEEGEYPLGAEKALTAVFGEDAGGLLVPEEGSWEDSLDSDPTDGATTEDPATTEEPTVEPTEAPATEAPTEAPATEAPTEAPATTAPAASEAPSDSDGGNSTMIIVIVVIAVVVIAAIVVVVMKKKKK